MKISLLDGQKGATTFGKMTSSMMKLAIITELNGTREHSVSSIVMLIVIILSVIMLMYDDYLYSWAFCKMS
jgi:hypothetical protein